MLGHDLFGRGGPETTRVDIFSEKKKHLYDIYMLFRMSSASSCDKSP